MILVAVAAALCCLLVMATSGADASGTWGAEGDNLTWTFDSTTGKLTISGTGAMGEYNSSSSVPWYSYCNSIKAVKIADGVTSIGNYAFNYCRNLTSIEISSSVTSIGRNAFSGCSSLTSVTFGENSKLTSIGNSAFVGCLNLTNIVMPEGITSIGELAFSDCRSLTSIEIPSSVISIGNLVFSQCSSLKYNEYDNGLYLGNVQNPYLALIDTKRTDITSCLIYEQTKVIAGGAFWECSNLMSIEIPSSVTSIGSSAFYNCSNLKYNEYDNGLYLGNDQNPYLALVYTKATDITSCLIHEQTKVIAGGAFSNCNSLTSIEIPLSVTSIGSNAFAGCERLTSIEIPSSVTSIGNYAFDSCRNLTNIVIDDNNQAYQSIDGVLFSKDQTTLIRYPAGKTETTYAIPLSVTSIGDYAFQYCRSLTNIDIPSSVTSIGNYAFSGCSSLYVIYNNSDLLLTIGNDECGEIAYYAKLIVDKDGNKTYKNDGAEYIDTEDGFFFKKQNGKYQLIAYFGKEETVSLPNDINGNSYEIYYMKGVRNVIIPDDMTSIGNSAFSGCSSLESVTVAEGNNVYHSAGNCLIETASKTLIAGCKNSVIPTDGSVTSIGDWAFSGRSSLTSIEIPSSVTNIGYNAFFDCISLKYNEYDNGLYLGNAQNPYFALITTQNDYITSCTIHTSTKVIANYAFSGCERLTSIEIPSSVTSIGNGAFQYCRSLTSITFGENSKLRSIGEYAFAYCKSLASIEIPSSVTSIGDSAFFQCNSLKYNEYDNGLYLGNAQNPYLALVYTKATDITSCLIHEQTKVIADSAFFRCSSLTSIEIPSSVTHIGGRAFNNCSSLESVTFGDNSKLRSIGDSAFYFCYSLTSIEIPSSVTSIGSWAFYQCSKLRSIEIPSSVTSIGSSAFYKSSLIRITILSRDVKIYDSSYTIRTTATIYGYAGSTAQAYAEKYGRAFVALDEPTHEHTYGEWENYNETLHKRTCSCGDVEYANHTWDSGVVTTEPTSTSQGVKTYTCTACGATKTETIPPTPIYSGICGAEGDNLTWGFDSSTGKLTISGTGEMENFSFSLAPWYSYRSSIKTIEIAKGVTSIGSGAFRNSNILTSVVFSTNSELTSIEYDAFLDCISLTNVEIPSSVTSIDGSAFSGCSSLESITVAEGNSVYHSAGNCIIETASKTLVAGCKNSVIPTDSSVTSIGGSAFEGCERLTSIEIPSSVTSIGYGAFSGCNSLTSIEIPSSVTSIGGSAFYYCRSLTSIEIPEGVTSIGDSVFFGCSGLECITVAEGNSVYHSEGNCLIETASKTLVAGCKSSVIPADGSVTSIRYRAFSGCSSLTSIEIPSSVTSIGNFAFSYCGTLTTIQIPSSVTRIGENVFQGCYSLVSIEIPSSVTSIGHYAFDNCYSLTSIEIPSSVTSIGNNAFSYCYSLTSITILSRDVEIYDSSNTIYATATIYGYADSTAQAYAEKHGNEFVALTEEEPYAPGDINGDETINSDDAIYLLKHTFLPEQYPLSGSGDMNGDGKVDSDDAVYLLKHTFLPEQYPLPD
ncbi:MAG: hypothetical protein DBY04_01130 [Clostridiales bacterium]|nr:MAG: hypothetical protein DBY04_01130 [Clostridiales bacterium]